MSPPFLLAHLSDPHIGGTWGGDADPVARLRAAVEAVRRLPFQPDAALVTGDLVDNATEGEYAQAAQLLAALELPLHVLPGNHDARATLRRHFPVGGDGADPVHYVAELGALRLIALDSTRPGRDDGALGTEQLEWLEARLASAPDTPTLVAMHHPPLVMGAPAFDVARLDDGDREALGAIVARHPQVRRIAAGHVHRPMTAVLGGRPVCTAPSTYVGLELDFGTGEVQLTGEPPGVMIHAVAGGEITTHMRTDA